MWSPHPTSSSPSHVSLSSPSSSPYNSPTPSRVKSPPRTAWELPTLPAVTSNRFRRPQTLWSALSLVILAIAVVVLSRLRGLRSILLGRFDPEEFGVDQESIYNSGLVLSVSLLGCAGIALFRYFQPPPNVSHLTNKQRELVGLSPSKRAPLESAAVPQEGGKGAVMSPGPASSLQPSYSGAATGVAPYGTTPQVTSPVQPSPRPSFQPSPRTPSPSTYSTTGFASPTAAYGGTPSYSGGGVPYTPPYRVEGPGGTPTYSSPTPSSMSYGSTVASPSTPRPSITEGDSMHYWMTSSPSSKGSPSSKVPEIKDEKSLEKYLSLYSEQERLRKQYESGESVQYVPISTTPLKYRTSLRPPPRSTHGPRDYTSEEFGYRNTQAAQELLERLDIEPYMQTWVENIRIWIVQFLLHPLVQRMQIVESVGLSLNAPPPTQQATSTPMWHTTPQQPSLFPATSPVAQAGQQVQHDVIEERHKIEKYLKVLGGQYSREYIVKRIKELAEGEIMSKFHWNSGGTWMGKDWTPELPTDSQIIIHLFCTFMDNMLPEDQSTAGKPFTNRHFVVFPVAPDPKKSSLMLFQRHIHPPHFEVVGHNENWPVYQGRNNLFQALVLFVYFIQKNFGGYLDQVSLSSKRIQLSNVVHKD